MLILSRKSGQSVRIGDSVRVTVVDVGRGQVRLGIEAEGSVDVYREEVFERIVAANQEAAGLSSGHPLASAEKAEPAEDPNEREQSRS